MKRLSALTAAGLTFMLTHRAPAIQRPGPETVRRFQAWLRAVIR